MAKVRSACAAAYVASPDWMAATVQSPNANMVKLVPETEQMEGVVAENATGSVEDAVALSAMDVGLYGWDGGPAKLMTCGYFATVSTKFCVAAAPMPLLAVMVSG